MVDFSAKRKAISNSETGDTNRVRVLARVRSLSVEEQSRDTHEAVHVHPPALIAVDYRGSRREFNVDGVLGPEDTQDRVFEQTARPLVDDFLGGLNCTLFAYGQTGTGKTWTISGNGDGNDTGIIPRVFRTVFARLSQNGKRGLQDWALSFQYVELYNEEILDLLSPKSSSKVTLREFQSPRGRATELHGAQTRHVRTWLSAQRSLNEATERRHTAQTLLNKDSSRSHAILILNIDCAAPNNKVTRSKFNIVDLAGSENIGRSGTAASQSRKREGTYINQTLLALGRVIMVLSENSENGGSGTGGKTAHVPYRESKLTRLLQDSLGGSSRTCMIATISPTKEDVEESLSTLSYACRTKNITNRPQLSPEMIDRVGTLAGLSTELERLDQDLNTQYRKDGTVHMTVEQHDQLLAKSREHSIAQDRIAQLQQRVDQYLLQLNDYQAREKDLEMRLEDSETLQQASETRLQSIKARDTIRQARLEEVEAQLKELEAARKCADIQAKEAQARYEESESRAQTLLQQRNDLSAELVTNVSAAEKSWADLGQLLRRSKGELVSTIEDSLHKLTDGNDSVRTSQIAKFRTDSQFIQDRCRESVLCAIDKAHHTFRTLSESVHAAWADSSKRLTQLSESLVPSVQSALEASVALDLQLDEDWRIREKVCAEEEKRAERERHAILQHRQAMEQQHQALNHLLECIGQREKALAALKMPPARASSIVETLRSAANHSTKLQAAAQIQQPNIPHELDISNSIPESFDSHFSKIRKLAESTISTSVDLAATASRTSIEEDLLHVRANLENCESILMGEHQQLVLAKKPSSRANSVPPLCGNSSRSRTGPLPSIPSTEGSIPSSPRRIFGEATNRIIGPRGSGARVTKSPLRSPSRRRVLPAFRTHSSQF